MRDGKDNIEPERQPKTTKVPHYSCPASEWLHKLREYSTSLHHGRGPKHRDFCSNPWRAGALTQKLALSIAAVTPSPAPQSTRLMLVSLRVSCKPRLGSWFGPCVRACRVLQGLRDSIPAFCLCLSAFGWDRYSST